MVVTYLHAQADISEGLEIPTEVVSNILKGSDTRHDRCSDRKAS